MNAEMLRSLLITSCRPIASMDIVFPVEMVHLFNFCGDLKNHSSYPFLSFFFAYIFLYYIEIFIINNFWFISKSIIQFTNNHLIKLTDIPIMQITDKSIIWIKNKLII
jgi:hypothetical protein